MKIIIFIGNHPRHFFFADQIIKNFSVEGVIIENREKILPNPNSNISTKDKDNFIKTGSFV